MNHTSTTRMKYVFFIIIAATLLISACTPVEKAESQDEQYYESLPIIDGYYEGERVWFIHPDVSSAEISEKLTRMINYKTIYVPAHNDAVDASKLAKLYVFTNGIDHAGVKPWGGGPLGYQIDIFDSIPEEEGYTSLRRPYLVTWKEGSRPRLLKSERTLLDAQANGDVTIEETDFVVNVPVLRWPGGSARLVKG